jgi:hypothetical protein
VRLSVNLETTALASLPGTLGVIANIGVDKIWVRDGVFGRIGSEYELLTDQEPFLLLGFLASRVPPNIGLGVSVLRLDYRKTVVSARMIASFAALFPGRSMTVGAGWKRGLRTDRESAAAYLRCIQAIERRLAGDLMAHLGVLGGRRGRAQREGAEGGRRGDRTPDHLVVSEVLYR